MKQILMVAAVALLGAQVFGVTLTEADLTPRAVRAAIAAKPAAERQAYAQLVLTAVAGQMIDEEEKTAQLISVIRALIIGAGREAAVQVIAEVYNTVPVEQLQAVSELLAENNFDQQANRLTDAAFDKLSADIVKSVSQYIEASGTDSPSVRMGMLAATFTSASSDPERTKGPVVAALPPSVRAAATTYMAASAAGNKEMLAAAAGVESVVDTPADPDADSIVRNDPPAVDPADTDYLEPQAPGEAVAQGEAAPGAPQVVDQDPDSEVKVPLIALWSSDTIGMTQAVMQGAMYDWAHTDPRRVHQDPPIPMVPGSGDVTLLPGTDLDFGSGVVDHPGDGGSFERPSPTYGNQYL